MDEQLAGDVAGANDRIREQVSAVAPYAMLTQAGVHGTLAVVTVTNRSIDGGPTIARFRIECGVCGRVWHESLDYEIALTILEDHLLAEHGDYGPQLVVAFR